MVQKVYLNKAVKKKERKKEKKPTPQRNCHLRTFLQKPTSLSLPLRAPPSPPDPLGHRMTTGCRADDLVYSPLSASVPLGPAP